MAAYDRSAEKMGMAVPGGPAVPPPYSYAGGTGGYPTAATAPLMQSGYPSAHAAYPAAAAYQYPHGPIPQGPMQQGPPPSYSVAMGQPGHGYQYGYPMYSQPTMIPHGATVVMPNGFDAGARFDSSARPAVPPPPPGVMPNSAQMAMMQGNSVVLGQQKSSFFSGGGADAGYSVW